MLATETLYTPYNGAVLLENPLLNKGLAFTQGERSAFNLQGLLPHNVETIEEKDDPAVEALISLGYNVYDAKKALDKVDSSLDISERIREALKLMG